MTRAIVERGTFQIDAFHEAKGWETGDKAFFNGHYYTDKAIGSAFMAVPIYYLLHAAGNLLGVPLDSDLIKHVLTTAVMGGSFTLAGLSMYYVARKITNEAWRAAWTSLLVCFGTMLWPYSALFYGHLPAAAFLVLAFALLFHLSGTESGGKSQLWFWVGLAVGMAFLNDHTAGPVIVGLAAYALYVLRALSWRSKIRRAWPAAVGLLLPLVIFFAYNVAVYGKLIAFGYNYEVEERFQGIMGLGVMGIRLPTAGASYHITFDPRFGLFWLSPLLLLAPVGYFLAFRLRRFRAEALLSIFAIAAMFYVNAASFLWYGGSTFGPRLLIPALPFFVIPLALLPTSWSPALAALGLVSIGNMLIPLLGQIQFYKLEFKPDKGGFFVAERPFQGFSLLYGYGLPKMVSLARAGNSPWTLGAALGLPLWLSASALILIQAVLLRAFRLVSSRDIETA